MIQFLWGQFKILTRNSRYRTPFRIIGFLLLLMILAITFALNSVESFCKFYDSASFCKKPEPGKVPPIKPATDSSANLSLPTPKSKIMLIDSNNRKFVMTGMEHALEDTYDVLLRPQSQDWMKQFAKIPDENPEVVVVHFHSLRNFKISQQLVSLNDLQAESELLRGLRELIKENNTTVVVLYSSSFVDRDEIDSRCAVLYASVRALKEEGSQSKDDPYKTLLNRIVLLPWSDESSTAGISNLRDIIAESLKKPFTPGKYENKAICDRRLKDSIKKSASTK